MLRRLFLTVLLLAIAGVAFGSAVLSRFEARTEGSDVVVTWQASVEENVRTYVLERKTPFDAQYREIKRMSPRGANQLYSYRDTQIYKTSAEQVQYRLRIVNGDDSFVVVDPIAIDYTPTAIRRTWGSIKAMFQ